MLEQKFLFPDPGGPISTLYSETNCTCNIHWQMHSYAIKALKPEVPCKTVLSNETSLHLSMASTKHCLFEKGKCQGQALFREVTVHLSIEVTDPEVLQKINIWAAWKVRIFLWFMHKGFKSRFSNECKKIYSQLYLLERLTWIHKKS